MIVKRRTLFIAVIGIALAMFAGAQESKPQSLSSFVKARLLAIHFGQDQSEPILSYQFEVLDEFGYMQPEGHAFISAITTSTYRADMPEAAVVDLFRKITETNYDQVVRDTLPKGVRLGSTVLAYVQVAPKCRVLEMVPYSEEAKRAFLEKHNAEIQEGQRLWETAAARAKRAACMNNLSQLGKATLMYQLDHTNTIPDLQSVTNYASTPKVFICPASGNRPGALTNLNQWTDYVLVSGITTASPPRTVRAYCPPQNHGGEGGNILFVDGSVEWVSADKFWEIVKNGRQ